MPRRFGVPFKGSPKRRSISGGSPSAKVRKGGAPWSSRDFKAFVGAASRGGRRS